VAAPSAGSGYGTGIFLQGTQSVTLAPLSGESLSIADVIRDEVASGGTGAGGLVVAGLGDVVLSHSNSFTGGITLQSGTLDLAVVGAAGSGGITFDPPDPTLQIDGTVMPTNAIADFIAGDTIDLTGITFSTLDTVTYSGTTFSIVNNGTTLASLTLTGHPYTASDFFRSQDSGTGTDITTDLPCFAAGTRILSERGAVPAEELRAGDLVVTLSGKGAPFKPVRWIGDRKVDCRRHPRPELVWPVRVRAGAFGPDQPHRDLLLSPDHAVFRDGVLIPIKYLINGATVVQERPASVHYFHIELASHDVLLAEGLPAESYLDTGNRAQFANGAAQVRLHPDFAALSWDDACAPLCVEGPAVVAARRSLLARIADLGYRRTAPSDVHLRANGRVIRPAVIEGKLHHFVLPASCEDVRIVSASGVPAGFDLANPDCRRLGARIGAIVVAGKPIALDSPGLVEGFHAIEQNAAERWRWTDGAALLRLPEQPGEGPMLLELLVYGTMRHWRKAEMDTPLELVPSEARMAG
jgi:autotransporter-associated beta strand protein